VWLANEIIVGVPGTKRAEMKCESGDENFKRSLGDVPGTDFRVTEISVLRAENIYEAFETNVLSVSQTSHVGGEKGPACDGVCLFDNGQHVCLSERLEGK